MAFYESVFIARQDISATQVETLADELAELVKSNGGEVARREYWGLRNLAYRIKKNRKGHYMLFNLDAPAGAVAELERIMRLNEDIIRYMTVGVKELSTEPSAVMQSRDSRGRDRDGRGRDRDRGGRDRGGSWGDRGGRRGDDRREPRSEKTPGGGQ
jgi:small subunit ribosomal protein S6